MEWMVYPNPATNMLYIQPFRQIEQIAIYGLMEGVLSDNSNQGGQYAILDVSTLPAGIYMICHTQAAGNNVYKFLVANEGGILVIWILSSCSRQQTFNVNIESEFNAKCYISFCCLWRIISI